MFQPTDELKAVWAEIPDVGCKGHCIESCGPIGASPLELRILAARGVLIRDYWDSLTDFAMTGTAQTCPALVNGRCSVYEVRPTVCRLWGAVDAMPCEWGCVPHGGRLTNEQGGLIVRRSMEAGS